MACMILRVREKVNGHHEKTVEKLDDQKGMPCSGECKPVETSPEPDMMHLTTTVLQLSQHWEVGFFFFS